MPSRQRKQSSAGKCHASAAGRRSRVSAVWDIVQPEGTYNGGASQHGLVGEQVGDIDLEIIILKWGWVSPRHPARSPRKNYLVA